MNANVVSIYNTKTAQLRAEPKNRLFGLGRVYDLGLGTSQKTAD